MVFGFGKKDKEKKKGMPLDKIKGLSKKGLSDREIISKLKDEGYSYNQIEKGMMQAVKEGVGNEPQYNPPPKSSAGAGPGAERGGSPAPSPGEAGAAFEKRREEPGVPTVEELGIKGEPEIPAEELEPEVALEELVEGVVDEKWNEFQDKFDAVEEEIELLRTNIKKVENKITNLPRTGGGGERMGKFDDRMDNLEARLNGLEKAFKQFLPSLTENVEELSRIIEGMKRRSTS